MIDAPIFLPLRVTGSGPWRRRATATALGRGDRATDMYEDHRDLDAEMTTALGPPGETSTNVWKFRAGAGTRSFSSFIWKAGRAQQRVARHPKVASSFLAEGAMTE